MNALVVEPVASSKAQRLFLELPWRLYQHDPLWVPPLRQNQKEMVGFVHHPFYDNNQAQSFLAQRGGRPCGRITAIVNRAHNERYGEELGFFGFFECENDAEAAQALFTAAGAWLRERGIKKVRGPANPSLNYECGLLVEGFDTSPRFMMTYNPPYYADLLTAAGFEKSHDLYAYFGLTSQLSGLDSKLHFIVAEATERFNLKLRTLDKRRFDADVRLFLDIYNQSLVGTWGFVPLSESEVRHMSDGLKHLIVPELTCICEVDGKPVGASFCLLDYNPLIKLIDGRLFPFGFLRILWGRRGIKHARVISTNVVPEYQMWGVGLVVNNFMVPAAVKWGISDCEFSWILESNQLSWKSLERGGARRQKIYRLYDRTLNGG